MPAAGRAAMIRRSSPAPSAGRRHTATEALVQTGSSLQPGARAAAIRMQAARADRHYRQGMAGIALLRTGRPAITLAATLYREILREIERRNYGEQPGRAVVSSPRKLRVSLRSLLWP